METIFQWVKNLVFFYLLMTAVCHLLPKGKYEKYVRFYGGLLLVVLLLNPILELLHDPDELLDKISAQAFLQKTDSLQLDLKGMEQVQKEAYLREYEDAIAMDITRMAEEEEMTVKKVSVELSEEYELVDISLSVAGQGQEDGIQIEKITLQDNSREYPRVIKLKEQLMDFYEIKEEQIRITMQED